MAINIGPRSCGYGRKVFGHFDRRLAQDQQITNTEIMAGLAGIARDSGNPAAARVSAYRTLADIKGLMAAPLAELPQGLGMFLKAIAASATTGQREQVSAPDVEVTFRDVQSSESAPPG